MLRLLSEHNLWLYGEIVAGARAAIVERRYESYSRAWLEGLSEGQ